jgi:hypothetical protein
MALIESRSNQLVRKIQIKKLYKKQESRFRTRVKRTITCEEKAKNIVKELLLRKMERKLKCPREALRIESMTKIVMLRIEHCKSTSFFFIFLDLDNRNWLLKIITHIIRVKEY